MFRILHIIKTVDPRGGGPIEGILRLRSVAEKHGNLFEQEIVTVDSPFEPFLVDYPVKVHVTGNQTLPAIIPGRLRKYGDCRGLGPWIRQNAHRFDCAIVHGLWNCANLGALLGLRGGTLPYFVYSHGMLDPWFAEHYPVKNRFKQLSWWLVEGPLVAGAKALFFTAEEERLRAQGAFRGHPCLLYTSPSPRD